MRSDHLYNQDQLDAILSFGLQLGIERDALNELAQGLCDKPLSRLTHADLREMWAALEDIEAQDKRAEEVTP